MTRIASSENLQQQCLDALAPHATGLRTDQVRAQLAALGVVIDLATVAAVLGEFQRSGTVTYKQRRWILAHNPKRRTTPPKPPATNSRPERPQALPSNRVGTQPSPVSDLQSSVRCLPFHAAISATAETSTPTKSTGGLPKGWPLIRRLLPYWRECLRAEERPNTILPLERLNIEFCGLTAAGEWWPTEQRHAELTLDAGSLPGELMTTFARRSSDTDVFIGYPLQLIPGIGDGGAFARPVFTFNCRLHMSAGILKVFAPPQPVDVNASWLEKQFRDAAERRTVLRWMGVITGADDESEGQVELESEAIDLPAVTTRLAAYLKTDGGAALTPTALATSLPKSTAATCLVNGLALFVAPMTRYSKRALADLVQLEAWTDQQFETSALRSIFNPPGRKVTEPAAALPPLQVNEDQLAAVRAGLNEGLTVITGPPGTGKSQVVAAIMACAALNGRTALLASKNHKALDAVEQRLAALTEHYTVLARASMPYGEGQGFDLQRATDALFARASSTGARALLDEAVGRLKKVDHRLLDIESRLRLQVNVAEEMAKSEAAIEESEFVLTPSQKAWIRGRASDTLPQPKIQLDQPGFALGLLGPFGRWLSTRSRRQFLAQLEPLAIPWSSEDDDERRLKGYAQICKYGQALEALDGWKQRLLPPSEVDALTDALVDGRRKLVERAADVFQTLPAGLQDLDDAARPALAEFIGTMGVFTGPKSSHDGSQVRRRVTAQALPILLRHFPLWAVTNLSAGRALPLNTGLFDIVVIDEASQCDIASAIPLLARAKQAVIVGDPAQLRHVTKCTQERERRLLEVNALLEPGIGRYSYRNQSLFHLAVSTPGVSSHLLRDHYRCAGAVVDYFNDAFYGGRLRVMTDENQLRPPPGQRPGIHWTHIKGPVLAAASGCQAPAEADAIVDHLRQLLVTQEYPGTIGVVTPFREQAKRITDRITTEMKPHLIAGSQLGAFTAHQFQGDARDLILLSLCLGPDMPLGSRSFLAESANLMNVAVSRARAVCHVFGNRDEARHSGIPHLVKLAAMQDDGREHPQAPSVFESPWEEILYFGLKERGIDPIPQFPIAGRRLDLAVIQGSIRIDVEVDGDQYHRDMNGRRKSSDLWRDHQLKSLGWRVKRYWVYQLRENLDGCLDDIIATANP